MTQMKPPPENPGRFRLAGRLHQSCPERISRTAIPSRATPKPPETAAPKYSALKKPNIAARRRSPPATPNQVAKCSLDDENIIFHPHLLSQFAYETLQVALLVPTRTKSNSPARTRLWRNRNSPQIYRMDQGPLRPLWLHRFDLRSCPPQIRSQHRNRHQRRQQPRSDQMGSRWTMFPRVLYSR